MTSRLKGILAFSASFIISLLLLYILFFSSYDEFDQQLLRELDFKNEIKISKPGQYLEFTSAKPFYPQDGKDFLLISWIRLSQLPVNDEKVHILSYYDSESKKHPGYALMIRRDADAVRPAVYWQDEEGKNRWLSFTRLTVFPKEWFFLAITFSEEKYLGLHLGAFGPSGEFKVKTLGGYEVKPLPGISSVPLIIGAIGSGNFKGKLGPTIIANLDRSPERIVNVLTSIALRPFSVGDVIQANERLLWFVNGMESEMLESIDLKIHPKGEEGNNIDKKSKEADSTSNE